MVTVGHLKRFEKGITELQDMLKSDVPSTVSPYINQFNLPSSPSHSISSSCSHGADQISKHDVREKTPPKLADAVPPTSVASSEDSGIASVTDSANVPSSRMSGNFSKMRLMLEKRMGGEDVEDDDEEDNVDTKPADTGKTTPPLVKANSEKKMSSAPPPIPKRAMSTVLTTKDSPLLHSKQMVDGEEQVDSVDHGGGITDILSGYSAVAPPRHAPPDATKGASILGA